MKSEGGGTGMAAGGGACRRWDPDSEIGKEKGSSGQDAPSSETQPPLKEGLLRLEEKSAVLPEALPI